VVASLVAVASGVAALVAVALAAGVPDSGVGVGVDVAPGASVLVAPAVGAAAVGVSVAGVPAEGVAVLVSPPGVLSGVTSLPPPCVSVPVGVMVGALVGGDGVLVGAAGVAVIVAAGGAIAVARIGGAAVGSDPRIVAGTKIVLPARSPPSVKQLTRRSSAELVCARTAISLSVSPCLTTYATQLGAWMRWQRLPGVGVGVGAGVGMAGVCITRRAMPCTASDAPGTI
jgi:hypothetical protein